MMNRRTTLTNWASLVLCSTLSVPTWAVAAGDESSAGVREALAKGAEFAVSELGHPWGFANNEKVRIPLPESLKKAEGFARQLGFSKQTDDFILAMNRAAEMAVVEAKPILIQSIKQMGVRDAVEIVTGSSDAATQYLRRTTSDDIAARFLPIVKQSTSKVELAQKYQKFVGGAAKLGLVNEKEVDLDNHITRKAMDGVFLMVAEQEKRIRKDPIGAGSALLGRVFGNR